MKTFLLLGLAAAGFACARETPVQPAATTAPAIQASQTLAGYEMIDLGTISGGSTAPMALNDAGQVVGYSIVTEGGVHEVGTDHPHAFLWENGAMRDLAASPELSRAQLIHENGEIVGSSQDDHGLFLFTWKNGARTTVATPPGGEQVFLVDNGNDGDIIGAVDNVQNLKSFIWQNGVRQSLGGLNPLWGYAWARAANKRNQIVGSSAVNQIHGDYIDHAFIWENGTMRDLGLLAQFPCDDDPSKNCGAAVALDINKDGVVVGASAADEFSGTHAVMWSGGVIQDLGSGPGGASAVAINDAGDIIGQIGLDAYVWRNGARAQLPSLGGPSAAVAINKGGLIAGTSAAAGGAQHAVVWSNGALVDLGSVPGGGVAVVAINDNGDVLGYSGTCAVRPEGGCFAIFGSTRAILWRRLNPSQVAQQ